MNKEDAQYTIKEIGWMEYYGRKTDSLKKQLEEVQRQIDNATAPKSPQGTENIGAGRSLSFTGKESYLNLKITQKDRIEKEIRKYSERYTDALVSYYILLDQTDEKGFVEDYFGKKMSKADIETKYHIQKAYRKIVSIVMEAL